MVEEELKKENVEAQKPADQPKIERNYKEIIVEVPETEDFIIKQKGTLLKSSVFTTESQRENVPEIFMRPMVMDEAGKVVSYESSESMIDVKQTDAMGKAAFIEYATNIDGTDYNFLQVKGCLKNPMADRMVERGGLNTSYPMGREGIAPLFISEVKPWDLVRFSGAANLEDLLIEKERYEVVSKTGIRTPAVLGTFKFTKEFCQGHGLPLPENDDPNDLKGETLVDYIKRNKDKIDPTQYERIKQICVTSPDSTEYQSAVLGENVRAFKNVFRVMEVENALTETNKAKRQQKLSVIFETSKKVFSKEFEQKVDSDEFIRKFASLMGHNTAVLLNNKLVQGAMLEHKQDVSLAAEVCDWDTSFQLTEEYLHNPKNYDKWVKDEEDRKEWEKQKYVQMYRQIFLMASNIKPTLEMARQMGATETEEGTVANFVEGIVQNLSEEERKNLFDVLNRDKKGTLQDIEGIAGKIEGRSSQPNPRILINLEGQQEFFDRISKVIKNKLGKKKK